MVLKQCVLILPYAPLNSGAFAPLGVFAQCSGFYAIMGTSIGGEYE